MAKLNNIATMEKFEQLNNLIEAEDYVKDKTSGRLTRRSSHFTKTDVCLYGVDLQITDISQLNSDRNNVKYTTELDGNILNVNLYPASYIAEVKPGGAVIKSDSLFTHPAVKINIIKYFIVVLQKKSTNIS